jgi:hypothetical protein
MLTFMIDAPGDDISLFTTDDSISNRAQQSGLKAYVDMHTVEYCGIYSAGDL